MANNRVQVKRTSTSGRTPNTTASYATNSQFISAGELALNMADGILYSSNGSAVIEIGANNTNQNITGNLSLSVNNKRLNFTTVNSSASAYFIQQNDDNFVFYTTDASYNPRAVWSIYANNSTGNLNFSTRTQFNGGLSIPTGVTLIDSTGSQGSVGQVLTSNGTGNIYWSSPGAASVNTAAQYTWTNTQTFSANISFTGNGIGITSNTGAIYLGGLADANWKIGRNTGVITKWRYTNNSIDIVTANSNLEGFSIGLVSGNSYFETGYLGTFIASNVTIGNASSNSTLNSTAIALGTAFTANATLVNAAAINVVNQTNTATLFVTTSANIGTAVIANSIGLTTTGFVNATTVVNSAAHTVGTAFTANSTLVNTAAINIVNQTNTATLFVTTSANIASSNVIANTAGVWIANSTGVINAAVHQVGTSFTANSTLVNAAAINIVNQTNTATLFVTTSANIASSNVVANTAGIFIANSTGIVNAAVHQVGTSFTANSTLVNAAAINIVNQTNTATLFVSTSANIASSNVIANTAGVWIANSTGVINAAVHQVGTAFTANSTLVNAAALNVVNQTNTGTLFVSTSANVGTAFQANSTSIYFSSLTPSGGIVNVVSTNSTVLRIQSSNTQQNNFIGTLLRFNLSNAAIDYHNADLVYNYGGTTDNTNTSFSIQQTNSAGGFIGFIMKANFKDEDLQFYTNATSRLSISNTGTVDITSNTLNLGTSTVAANGYIFLSDGMKMNWGTCIANSIGQNAITFTSAFTTNAYSISLTPVATINTVATQARSVTKTGFTLYTANSTGSATNTGISSIYFTAIGF